MIPPRGDLHLFQGFQRELADVQSYIQARVPTEDPYLLNVNPAQLAEYQDELAHYVKQKQRTQRMRRPLPVSQDRPANPVPRANRRVEEIPERHTATIQPHRQTSATIHRDEPGECTASVVPKRLPGFEWLLAHTHYTQASRYDSLPVPPSRAPEVSVMWPPPPLPCVVHSLGPRPPGVHHHTFKKQKTM